jgi:hypothetical protein
MIASGPEIEDEVELLRNGCPDFMVETGSIWVLVGELFHG